MQSLFAAAFSSGAATAPVQLRYRHGDGSWRLLEALGRRVEDEHGAMTVINARDVTDRVRLEEEFRQAQKMEALARITSAVAHDFDNLLTVIRGNVALALEDTGHDMRAELLEIRKAAEVGSAMIGQLMTFGGRKRRSVVVDVNDHVADAGDDPGALPRPVRRAQRRCPGQPLSRAHGRGRARAGPHQPRRQREASHARGRAASSSRRGTCAWRVPGPGHTVEPLCDFVEIEVADTGAGMTPEVQRADHRALLHDEARHARDGPRPFQGLRDRA